MTSDSNAKSVAMTPEVWREALLENLNQGGKVCRRAARYIAKHDVEIGFSKQNTGARWTADGRIELNDKHYSLSTNPANPYLLSLIIHEVVHLEQGIYRALSVEGEYEAWRSQIAAREELGKPVRSRYWRAIAQLPSLPTKRDLLLARSAMMKATSWTYLIWLLPIRPSRTYAAIVGGVGKIFDRKRR
jgi:hypothetical protein